MNALLSLFLFLQTSHAFFINKCIESKTISTRTSIQLFEKSSRSSNQLSRRQTLGIALLITTSFQPHPASAFDRAFPDELTDLDSDKNYNIVLGSRSNSSQRKTAALAAKDKAQNHIFSQEDVLPSFTWGAALWFLLGSRSNPLTKPLANVLYDKEEEEWLKDLNDGLFAAPPLELLALLGFVFVLFGFATQFLLLQLAEGETTVCFQLAGVALIWGGFFEIGRIASGEKRVTRETYDRAMQLREEFKEFAENRLISGGSCHRSDVIAAFRRYFSKYRDPESSEYPLIDLEVEKLLKSWNEIENRGQAEMTSAGFYKGLQVNKDADVFVSR